MATTIVTVDVNPTHFSETDYENADAFHDALIKLGLLNCNVKHTDSDRNPDNGYFDRDVCIDKVGLYIITTRNQDEFVVDPSENEHMERFLAGTDDPLYDLVHELRYNPHFRLDAEIQSAENHFKRNKIE
jgi:hypothetical protein